MTTPSDFMDRKLNDVKMTSSWAFWNIEPPTEEDEIITRIPIVSISEASKDASESVSIQSQLKAVIEANENLAAEIYEVKGTLEFLIKMLGGK
jgi:hypothetical protein